MAGEYWRCKRCGNVWRQAPESVGNPNDGVRHRSGPGEPLCPGKWEPVVVLPVAEYERLRGIEARLSLLPRNRKGFHNTYNGGWHGSKDGIRAFHHGMDTVFNWLDEEVRAVLGEEKP